MKPKTFFRLSPLLISAFLLALVAVIVNLSIPNSTASPMPHVSGSIRLGQPNPTPPTETVKLIFIHHSVGSHWLSNADGELMQALNDNNYYVSDTNRNISGDPYDIAERTDIGDWWEWFASPNADEITAWLYNRDNTRGDNSIPNPDDSRENQIIMFKSCFPNSDIWGNPDDPPNDDPNPPRGFDAGSPDHNVANIKRIYNDLLAYFETRQDKLFIVIAAPPLIEASTDITRAANARAVNNWLVHEWLADYPYHNVAVFDFYNVLTTNGGDPDTNDLGWSTGNHHRLITTTHPITIQHQTDDDDDGGPDYLEYPTDGGTNNHPSPAGNRKATAEFVPLLNAWYNCWANGDCWDDTSIAISALTPTVTIHPGETATFTLSINTSGSITRPVLLDVDGAPGGTVVTWSANPVMPPDATHLRLSNTAHLTPADYALTATATYTPLMLLDRVPLTLTVTPAPTFAFSVSPPYRTVIAGNAVTFAAHLTALHGFDQPVYLSLPDLPDGMSGAWTADTLQPQPTADSQYVLWTTATVTPATYLLHFHATAGDGNLSTAVTATVTTTTDLADFVLSVAPLSRTVTPPDSVTYTLSLSSLQGFSLPVQLAVSALPAHVTPTWNLNPAPPDGDVRLTLTTSQLSPPGEHNLLIVASANVRMHVQLVHLFIDYPYHIYLAVVEK